MPNFTRFPTIVNPAMQAVKVKAHCKAFAWYGCNVEQLGAQTCMNLTCSSGQLVPCRAFDQCETQAGLPEQHIQNGNFVAGGVESLHCPA